MSLPREEARALADALQLLCDLSSGAEKRIPTATRQRARDALRHYPLAADERWIEAMVRDICVCGCKCATLANWKHAPRRFCGCCVGTCNACSHGVNTSADL